MHHGLASRFGKLCHVLALPKCTAQFRLVMMVALANYKQVIAAKPQMHKLDKIKEAKRCWRVGALQSELRPDVADISSTAEILALVSETLQS